MSSQDLKPGNPAELKPGNPSQATLVSQETTRQSWLSKMSSQATTPASNPSTNSKIMEHFKDKFSKQEWEHLHSRANTCLPATADGHHPVLVLINRKSLVCKSVCQNRVDDTADTFGFVDSKVTAVVNERPFASEEFSGGKVDEASFRQMVEDLVRSNGEMGGRAVKPEELDVLMHFVPLDKDGTVASDGTMLKSKLNMVLTLWALSEAHRDRWLAGLRLPLLKAMVLTKLAELNQHLVVKTREASWIQDKFLSIPCDPAVEERKLLLCLAYWYSSPQARPPGGLNRVQLLQRIHLESVLWTGLLYFVLWVAVFVLFAFTLIESGSLEHCRGIKGNLDTQLALGNAKLVTSLKQVYGFAQEFASNVANFVPLSETYFFGGHVWTIQDAPRKFSVPVPVPHLMEPMPNDDDFPRTGFFIGRAFTLQAWVQFSQEDLAIPKQGLSLLKKALPGSNTLTEDSLSCWNWRFPPQIVFGAQDYGQMEPNKANGRFEEVIAARNYPDAFAEANRSVLHTLLVDQHNVTFMVDYRIVDTVILPRPVTDCLGKDIELGDRGLTLASVRFFPQRLTTNEVAQIFRSGSTWKEIGRVVNPQKMTPMTEVAATQKTSLERLARAEATTAATSESIWIASTLVAAHVLRGTTQEVYVNREHPVTAAGFEDITGYRYWEVYTRPVFTNKQSKNAAEGSALPQRGGASGFTITSWVKIVNPGYLLALAQPLFSAADAAAGDDSNPQWKGWGNMCYMIWVGGGYTGFYTATAAPGKQEDGPTYHVKDDRGPAEWQMGGKAYRFFAFSIDPSSRERPFKVCIDGVCTGQKAIDDYADPALMESWPPAASCLQTGVTRGYNASFQEAVLNQSRLYLNRRQLDDWHLTGWQMSTKYFDRLLTDGEIRRLFNGEKDPEDGRPIRETKGCKLPREIEDNQKFRDSFGQDCYWYFQARRTNEAVCNDPIVKQNCPVACNYYERCWGSAEQEQQTPLQIWSSQMEIRTRGKHGTMCVAKSTTPEKEAISCALNSPDFQSCRDLKDAGGEVDCGPRDCTRFLSDARLLNQSLRLGAFREELLTCLGNTRWVPDGAVPWQLNYFVPCADIVRLSMDECSWDDSALETVANSAKAGGEWSMSFWYEALRYDGCAEPTLRFLDGDGSTFAFLGGLGGLELDIRSGRGWRGGCSPDRYLAFGHKGPASAGHRMGQSTAEVLHPAAQPGAKHFVVVGRRADGSLTLTLDNSVNTETAPAAGWSPVRGGKGFLRVVNIGGDLRLSPILVRASYPSVGDIGYMRFSQQVSQDMRVGPLEPLQEQMSRYLTRKPVGYSQKTMLLVPPFILLKRKAAGSCMSNAWVVQEIFEQNKESQCRDPYTCPNYQPGTVYTCPTDKESSAKHFGHRPVDVDGKSYYFEFLASITDNAVIVRESDVEGSNQTTVRKTREFVDILTSEAQIKAIFYSVEFGIMSHLTIKFDTSKGRVTAVTEINHSVAVRDGNELKCTILFVVCIICLVGIASDMIRVLMGDLRAHRGEKGYLPRRLRRSSLDFLIILATFTLIILQMLNMLSSSEEMKEMLERLVTFDWEGNIATAGGQDEKLTSLKRDYMIAADEVESRLFLSKTRISSASTVLSIVLLIRMVLTTNAHPRLELITRTLELATSDLMHFLLLMTLILVGFALLGTWMFGNRRYNFRQPSTVMYALVDSVLGPPGNLPILDNSYTIVDFLYVAIFHMMCFFFMLNFVLAIIVDSYTKVMEEVRECIVDQDVVSDVCSVFRYRWLQYRYRFPRRSVIKAYLEDLDEKFVTMEDLWAKIENGGEEIFVSQDSARAFYENYLRYSFLTEDTASSEPTTSDLGMISALTMHKIEMVHKELLERIPAMGGLEPASRPAAKPTGAL